MACYSPWVVKGADVRRPFSCGQCHGCRLERARQWGVRCMHEASCYDLNCFITLTYKEAVYNLDYSDFQSFMKRLRARFRVRIRFYMCGEYGDSSSRAHFHACLFNFDFPDKVYHAKTDSGSKLYRSSLLEQLWPHGFCSIGEVNFESAAYVARYCMKKQSGLDLLDIVNPDTGEVYRRVKEFARMSNGGRLKSGGIGKPWFDKFKADIYPHDYVVVNGREARPPRYYDKLYRKQGYGAFMELSRKRAEEAARYLPETTPQRLEVREIVSKAKLRKGSL